MEYKFNMGLYYLPELKGMEKEEGKCED